MSSWTPTNYKTKNWSHYNRALKQRGSLSIWFDAEMAWEAKPSGHRGRQQAYSDAAIQACLTMKVLFGLPLRQTTGFVESLLEFIGLDWSSHRARMRSYGSLTHPEPGRETKRCDPQSIWVERCGDSLLDITVEAALRRKCIV
jgi:hypothetical protein